MWRASGALGIPVTLCLLTCLVACSARDDTKSDDAVRQYIRMSVALGEHDTNSLDYYYGPPEWVADVHAKTPALDQIKKDSLNLMTRLQPVAENAYLTAQLRALAERADLLRGVHPTFEQEADALFGLATLPQPNQAHLDQVRKEIMSLLPGKGTLAHRYAAFDQDFIIPDDKVPAVMERALQGCRERTLQHLHLPAGEAIRIEYVSNHPWNAYSRYQGNFKSLIQVNADFALTVDRALQLACHEGYPGHHAYNSLQDAQLVQREGRRELMVQPTFSPQSLVSEALATYAVEMAFPGTDRVEFERDTLFPLAGIDKKHAARYVQVSRLIGELDASEPDIARDYLDGKLEWARAASALEDQALMAHTESTIKYLNEFRTYMLTYTVGREMAANCVEHQEDRWRAYERLILWRVHLRDCGT